MLVGAPKAVEGLAGGGGIAWYRSKLGDTGNVLWELGGDIMLADITPNPAAASTDLFGSSFAVPPASAGDAPPWVAVGAPGRSGVFIFQVDPGTGSSDPAHTALDVSRESG